MGKIAGIIGSVILLYELIAIIVIFVQHPPW